MSEPQSPFDESLDEPMEDRDDSEEHKLPDRKWSLVILAGSMFVLVWVREIVGFPHAATLGLSVLVFFAWLFVHATFFVDTRESEEEFEEEIEELQPEEVPIYKPVPSFELPANRQSKS